MEGLALGDDPLSDFDCDAFLEQLPDPHVDDIFHEKEVPSALAGGGVLSEIENLLMADDEDDCAVIPATPSLESDYDKLLAEILVEPHGDSDDGSTPSIEDPHKDRADAAGPKEVGIEPVSKKLLRDAAARSRERKTKYVKDLEMKSRYYEGECRRLGHLLQCCYAENHALRLCLQARGALNASMTKQESAVLLLESLLLGSLLLFMGVMCQFSLRLTAWLTVLLPRENKEQRNARRVARKGPESDISECFWVQSSTKSRSCRASRRKMKFFISSLSLFYSSIYRKISNYVVVLTLGIYVISRSVEVTPFLKYPHLVECSEIHHVGCVALVPASLVAYTTPFGNPSFRTEIPSVDPSFAFEGGKKEEINRGRSRGSNVGGQSSLTNVTSNVGGEGVCNVGGQRWSTNVAGNIIVNLGANVGGNIGLEGTLMNQRYLQRLQ
ncbi:bZIP transcription factor 60 [Arachis duranensis]|uniref:BZIP transcription factor 60 n=1 Tax=Arachis duranensis TaxID=130453 RepID=A0A9C6WQW5_ARADU|nr:bZIP transcription factor 60 [Arachis duranensis]